MPFHRPLVRRQRSPVPPQEETPKEHYLPPAPPEEEIPHYPPKYDLHPATPHNLPIPPGLHEYTLDDEEVDIPWENYMSTTAMYYRHEKEAQAAQAEAIQKHRELTNQLNQERQKERLFRTTIHAAKFSGIKPDKTVVNNHRKSRAQVRYIEKMIKDNEDNVQPKLRQKVEDIRKKIQIYHDQSHWDVIGLPLRPTRSVYEALLDQVMARKAAINHPKLIGQPLTQEQKAIAKQKIKEAQARLDYYNRTTHLPEDDNLQWDVLQEGWTRRKKQK
jgi:hypothetical protein